MRNMLLICGLLALLSAGCKRQYWTFVPGEDPVMTANVEPEPPVETETPKEIIFVLGIDGMD